MALTRLDVSRGALQGLAHLVDGAPPGAEGVAQRADHAIASTTTKSTQTVHHNTHEQKQYGSYSTVLHVLKGKDASVFIA